MKIKVFLAPGLWALVASEAAHGASAGEAYTALQDTFRKSNDLRSSLERMDADPKSDAPAIFDYYSDRKKTYLADPLRDWSGPALRAAQEYTNAVTGAANTIVESKAPDAFKVEYTSCINQVPHYGELDRAAENLVSPVRTAAGRLSTPWRQGASIPPDDSSALESQMSAAAFVLDAAWATSVNNCCRTAAAKEIAASKPAPDPLYALCNQVFNDVSDKKNAFQSQLAPLVTVTPPNPLNIGTLKPYEIAAIIKERTHLQAAHGADAEEAVFRNFEQTCEQKRLEAQNRSQPVKVGLLLGLAKSLRCDILPSLGTAFGGLAVQRMATGLARPPIAGKDPQGGDWDVNCDQQSLNALDSARPTDPATIAKTWGLDQMANPPYVQSLRALPSLSAPFPITAVPTGGYLTPFGGIGLADPNKVTGFGASVNGSSGTVNSAVTRGFSASSGATRQVAASRGVARGMARGVAQGSSLALGARALSSQISLGRSPLHAAGTLRSGAANSRAFVSRVVANNAQASSAQRRRNAVAAASPVRATVRSVASSKGSRVTSESLLGSLAGRPAATAGGVPGVVGAVANLQKTADEQRAKIETMARSYINNIDLAVKKGDDVRLRIQQLAANRDLAIQQALNDMIGASPRKQSDRATKLRRETTNIDKELASLKAQYDVYNAAVLEQSSMVQTLMVFGPKGTNYPGVSNPGRVSTGAALGPRWQAPSLLRALLGGLEAWAVNRVAASWNTDAEWAQQWSQFLREYEGHVNRKRAEESAETQSLARMIQARSQAITPQTVTDSDIDTLITVDLYARALQEETSDLLVNQALKGRDAPNLDGNTLALLRQARDEAEATRAGLDKIALQYKESYPERSDDDGEAWWAVVPDLILY